MSPCPSNLITTVKKYSEEQNCLHPGVSAKFAFTPFMPVFVMYHSQIPSTEMDRVWPTESDSKAWPKSEFSKHMEAGNEHVGSDLNSAWELANLKAEDSISLHSMPCFGTANLATVQASTETCVHIDVDMHQSCMATL